MKNFVFWLKFHWVQLTNNPALVKIMAWCRICDKPLSEPILTLFNDIYAALEGDELMCHRSHSSHTQINRFTVVLKFDSRLRVITEDACRVSMRYEHFQFDSLFLYFVVKPVIAKRLADNRGYPTDIVYNVMSWWRHQMKTFRVTGPLCEEFTGHRWIPRTKTSDAEL